jgi:hypothetical protein
MRVLIAIIIIFSVVYVDNTYAQGLKSDTKNNTQPNIIRANTIQNIDDVGYKCYSLINYRCTFECINLIERELKHRKCTRSCLKKNFSEKNCN